MKKKLMRTLVALVLACALVMPAACNTNGKNAEPSLTFEKTSIALKLEVNETEDVKFTATKLEEITFESDKPLVATGVLNEDSTALTVTAKRPGSAKITAKTETKDLAVLNVTVTQDVKITANATLDVDLESQTSTISFALNDSSATVTAKSENPAVVETGAVDLMKSTVALTPKSTGTANVVLTAKNANSEDTATVAVTVKDMYDTAPTDIFTFEDDNNGGWIISITDVEGYIESIAADDDDLEAEGATLIIPSTYNEKPVTEIKANFLKSDAVPNLAELYLPASVKVIGESAFEGCAVLKSVHIKSGSALETISAKAFANCTALENFDGLSKEDYSGCTQLKTIGASAFFQHKFKALYIPKSVTRIENLAFAQQHSLLGVNANELETLSFEPDNTPENAVSIVTSGKLPDAWPAWYVEQMKKQFPSMPDEWFVPSNAASGNYVNPAYDDTFCPYNGAFAYNASLTNLYLRNIKSCESMTFWGCMGISDYYIDENTAANAFAYTGAGVAFQTGAAFYGVFKADGSTTLTIDNAMIESMKIVVDGAPTEHFNLWRDSAGILGALDLYAGAGIGYSVKKVYVKDTLTPSDSFKQYFEESDSDKDGYTYWVWKQA